MSYETAHEQVHEVVGLPGKVRRVLRLPDAVEGSVRLPGFAQAHAPGRCAVKIGLDYWNVCSSHPDYFRWLAEAGQFAGHEVHVISAIGSNRIGTVAGEITRLGIPVTAVHEVVFRHPRESPELKVAKALELGLDVFYDDRDDVCQAMTAAGILANRVTRAGKRSDTEAEQRVVAVIITSPEAGDPDALEAVRRVFYEVTDDDRYERKW